MSKENKYRKLPIEILAIQWDGNLETLNIFPQEDIRSVKLREGELYIQTLEGEMHCSLDDFIIQGINNEYYPCKPNIFHKTYEKVD